MFSYTVAVVCVLESLGFWKMSLLKDTVFWFCSSGIVVAFSVITSEDKENILSRALAGSVKAVVVLQFLINTYTFSLPVELVLVPVSVLVATMRAVSETDNESASATKLLTGVQIGLGLGIVLFASLKAASDYAKLGTTDSITRFLLPIVLSLAFVPCIYLLVLVATYELLFIRLKMGQEVEPAVERYAKIQIILHCGLSLKKLKRFAKAHALDLMRIRSKDDMARLLDSAQDEV
jgi:hypothetical protein